MTNDNVSIELNTYQWELIRYMIIESGKPHLIELANKHNSEGDMEEAQQYRTDSMIAHMIVMMIDTHCGGKAIERPSYIETKFEYTDRVHA